MSASYWKEPLEVKHVVDYGSKDPAAYRYVVFYGSQEMAYFYGDDALREALEYVMRFEKIMHGQSKPKLSRTERRRIVTQMSLQNFGMGSRIDEEDLLWFRNWAKRYIGKK